MLMGDAQVVEEEVQVKLFFIIIIDVFRPEESSGRQRRKLPRRTLAKCD